MKYLNAVMVLFISSLSLITLGCSNVRNYYNDAYAEDNQLTLGVVQREIYRGMSQDEIAMTIGSPNIVTKDKENRETWIYDKIATQVRTSGTSGIILFCSTGADYLNRKDVSQRTLTVVIKFDENRLVDSTSYHSSKF